MATVLIIGASRGIGFEIPRLDDRDRDERERKRQEEVGHERMRQEEALDEALKNTLSRV